MRITPVDKPPDGDDGSGRSRGRRSSIRAYVGRFLSWLVSSVTGSTQLSNRGERSPSRSSTDPERDAPDLRPVEETDRVTVADFPNRDRPLTQPARDSSGINSPDVVSIETEEGLRLSVPENPEAELVSDVWTTVDP